MGFRTAIFAAFLLIGTVAFAQRVAPNSFIDHHVASVSQLVQETRKHPDVMDRFKRHFSMSDEEVLSYLGSLHTDRLAAAGVYTIYSVPADGHIKAHKERLAAGTAIFADSSGAPILLVKCGNPLSRGPQRPTEVSMTRPRVRPGPVHENPVAEVVPAPPVFPSSAPEVPEMVPLPVAPAPTVTQIARVSNSNNFPWPLLLIPLVFIHSSGGDHEHHQPVPEPASLLVFGVGAGALLIRKHRTRAQRL